MSQDSECQTFPIFPMVQPGTSRLRYENNKETLSSLEKLQERLKIAFGCTELFIKKLNVSSRTERRKLARTRSPMCKVPRPKTHCEGGSSKDISTSAAEYPSLDEVTREEVQQALCPVISSRSVAVNRRNEPPRRPRTFSTIKTDDNRPVCFYWGRPHHVVRYCRKRRAIFDAYRSRQAANSQPPSLNLSPDECSRKAIRTPSPIPSREKLPVHRYRSHSPYGRRSPSRSPIHRDEEN
ncbi:CCHC-type domain-containing protein [Trichonephila clavipes]|nr:CCHC-type domain-containing protein [Trichonephila clavipes]